MLSTNFSQSFAQIQPYSLGMRNISTLSNLPMSFSLHPMNTIHDFNFSENLNHIQSIFDSLEKAPLKLKQDRNRNRRSKLFKISTVRNKSSPKINNITTENPRAENFFDSSITIPAIELALQKSISTEAQDFCQQLISLEEINTNDTLPTSEQSSHWLNLTISGSTENSKNESTDIFYDANDFFVDAFTESPDAIQSHTCLVDFVASLKSEFKHGSNLTAMTYPTDFIRAIYLVKELKLNHPLIQHEYLTPPFDQESLLTAAILYFQSVRQDWQPAATDTIDSIKAQFQALLLTDRQAIEKANRWIPNHAASHSSAGIWFDGLAINGAIGKTCSLIAVALSEAHQVLAKNKNTKPQTANKNQANSISSKDRFTTNAIRVLIDKLSFPQLTSDYEEIHTVTAQELAITDRKFHDVLEDVNYPLSTPFQSLATIIRRLGPLFNTAVSQLDQPVILINRFHELEQAWDRSKKYLYSPRVMAALHLARTSGVFIGLDNKISEQITAYVQAELGYLVEECEAIEHEKLNTWLTENGYELWRDLAYLSEINLQAKGLPKDLKLLKQLASRYNQLNETREVISAANHPALFSKAQIYLKERLLAYLPIPSYQSKVAVENILLRSFNISIEEIYKVRNFEIIKYSPGYFYPPVKTVMKGSLVDEFFIRARLTLKTQQQLNFLGHSIDTETALQAEKERFLSALQDSTIVQAKAKEMLRLSQKPLSDDSVAIYSRSITELMNQETDWLTISKNLIQKFLISNPIKDAVQTITTGTTTDILKMLPLVGSLYEIEQGLQHKNSTEIESGFVSLSMDALFFWLGGVSEKMIVNSAGKVAAELYRLPAYERTAVSMLHSVDSLLGKDTVQAIPLLTDEKVVSDPFGLSLPVNDDVSKAEEFSFSFSKNPDAELEAKPKYNEKGKSLVQSETGPEKTSELLKQDEYEINFGPEEYDERFDSEEINTGQTVKDLVDWFKQHDLGLRPNRILPIRKFLISLQNDAETRAMLDELDSIARRSPTLQRLLRIAEIDHFEPWELTINREFEAAAIRNLKTITMPSNLDETYLAPSGTKKIPQGSALLHEFLHSLTELDDYIGENPDWFRGPIVYLTDRVHYEAGFDYEPRLNYEYVNGLEFVDGHINSKPLDKTVRQLTFERMIAENFKLDTLLSRSNINAKGEELLVMEQSVAERITVREVIELNNLLKTIVVPEPSSHNFNERLSTSFNFKGVNQIDKILIFSNSLLEMSGKLYAHKNLFRILFDHWYYQVKGKMPWSLQFKPQLLNDLDQPIPWAIDQEQKLITLSEEPTYYLSREGWIPLMFERSWMSLLIELSLGEKLPINQFDVALNRGAKVWLENRVLKWTSGMSKQRLNAQLGRYIDDGWDIVDRLSKASIDENVFLEQELND